jgi:hypothetical protein
MIRTIRDQRRFTQGSQRRTANPDDQLIKHTRNTPSTDETGETDAGHD